MLISALNKALIYIKLILISALNKVFISALNKALISALNKERMCLYRPFIFVTDDVPYSRFSVLEATETYLEATETYLESWAGPGNRLG